MPRTHAMPLRRTALAAGALLAALSLTACDGSTGSGSGGGSNSSSAKADQPLKLGQPSPETQEVQRYNKTGKFTITPQKVVMGKPADLDELKDQKYKGYTLAWAYVKAKLVGGDTPLRGPMIATNVGMQMEGGQQGTRLIVLMGGLSSRPADCHSEDTEAVWQKGDEPTLCVPFVVPEGRKVAYVLYSKGFSAAPLKWAVE
ncbi:hypothetical protein FHS39_003772 [Streptomyces olivoverticillatus]|uniref:Lipoprotein n=1 Tax=Streptomyces olivoverticillatus TaxID=66427 RepID=A0A7W7LQR7_9ACTN|nr:hypothetical protein [Streptomyces olivoverticillatus]MBB4894714.1 hypothetical protein [Streptomyces olivoverticillatus]